MHKNILIFLCLSLILIWGCKSPAPFKTKKDLIGQWKGTVVDISTPSHLRTSFPFRKYGIALMELNNDSSFTYTLEINRDVVLEKEVLGNPFSKTLIKSVYKEFQKGKFTADDTSLVLNDPYNRQISKTKYFFKERALYTEFLNKDKLTWLIAWEKN